MKNKNNIIHKSLFISLTIIFYACSQNALTENSIRLDFPLYTDLNNIPSGWTLDDHYGYALHNSNVKKIFINDTFLEGNFDLTVYTNEPLKKQKKEYDFKGASFKVSPTIASNIWDVLLKQNIPMYDVTEDIVIDWIDLNNNVEYSYSPKDSVFMITYLIPYSSDSQNRRNRLKERLNLKQ